MDIEHIIKNARGVWRPGPPGNAEVIAALQTQAPIKLPDLYLRFLALSNGGEGDLGIAPGWFAPWPAENVAEHNRGYEVVDSLPGFWAFGSNGGGEMFAFDARGSTPWPIVMVPFMPMELEEVVCIAPSFEEFAQAIGTEHLE